VRAPHLVLCVAVLIALLGGGCDSQKAAPEAAKTETRTDLKPTSTPAPEKSARKERPLPAFGGWTLDDQRLEISSLLGKRVIVFFFNPEVASSAPVAQALADIQKYRGEQNFEIVGVAVGASREAARAFVAKQGLAFRVIDDSSAQIAGRFGLRTPLALLGVDAEGYVTFGMAQFPSDTDARPAVEQQLRMALRLPEANAGTEGKPEAPTFVADVLDGEKPFDLAAQRGKPVILLFFLHTCPHCHDFLEFIKGELASMDAAKRPVLVGVELTGRAVSVRERLREDGLDFFPVVFDEDGKIRAAYGVFGAVPDIVLIDPQGRIAARRQGFAPDTDAPLLRMRLARLAGLPVPMLLRKEGYSGNEACSICHESQHDTWVLTAHASAFDTLVRHGADSNAECVSCHVVGFGKPGGYDLSKRDAQLEDVGCENCHGRGGPHLSPEFVKGGDYTSACATCHDPKHSLGFEYATFLPRISHAANLRLLALPAKERERLVAERGAARTDLLPVAKHVGSEACKSCHPVEYEKWSKGPHAAAFATLTKAGRQGDKECQSCHTTGFGRDGGFPPGSGADAHADLARVGCESCHGPGGNHVPENARKRDTIVSLGDKCDSCVILQICGSCHDQANDPGFEFQVVKKIDAIRHGTIDAGGKPKADGKSARALPEPRELLSRAFAVHDAALPRSEPWTGR
jgi:peroxiredoxin/nitrate/TMAO reductase-like tetraheme cytochrome c subunit